VPPLAQIISSQLSFGLLIQSSALKLFSSDSLVRERETTSGAPIIVMYIGKLIASIPEFSLLPLAYVFGNFSFIKSQASFVEYYAMHLLLAAAITGLANFLAITFQVKVT
jgi:hypothetical protein